MLPERLQHEKGDVGILCGWSKKKKATRELHPSWWGMIALCRQATEQLSLIFSNTTNRLMQHTKESRDISDKHILNQNNNNNSFYMLLRVEMLQSMWPRHILTVPGLSSATVLWLREAVYAIQVLNTLKSCFFQSPLNLPLEMHRLTWPSGIVQTYQHTTRSVV